MKFEKENTIELIELKSTREAALSVWYAGYREIHVLSFVGRGPIMRPSFSREAFLLTCFY